MATKHHICVDMLNAIANTSSKDLTAMFKNENGERPTYDEVLEEFRKDIAKGYKYFTGCDNREPDGRCAGHPIDEKEEST